MKFNQTMAQRIRKILLSVAQNESVFLCAIFFSYSFLSTNVLIWHAEAINAFNRWVILPWGGALCLLRLYRAHERDIQTHTDIRFLTLLYMWIVVPFGIRFGMTAMNVNDWFHFMVAFFGVYALITEETAERRGMLMDVAGALFAVISFVMGASLLYCAYTAQTFGQELSEMAFGLYTKNEANNTMYILTAGLHYNSTGMFGVCCTLMCLLGVCRRKHFISKLAHLVPALMMAAVVVLTQSRTARYSMLAAWAVGAYGAVAGNEMMSKKALRQMAAVALGVSVFAAGYVSAAKITDMATYHYESVLNGQAQPTVFSAALAEEAERAEMQQTEAQNEEAKEMRGRGVGDLSFTGRTFIWNIVIEIWKSWPKYFVIGFGVGHFGSLLAPWGTGLTTHNAYLGFISNYGIIGFILLCCFFVSIIRPMCRVFFASNSRIQAGDRVMAMMVVATLLTGLMETEPFGAMSPMNAVLMFSMAMLVARGRELKADKLTV